VLDDPENPTVSAGADVPGIADLADAGDTSNGISVSNDDDGIRVNLNLELGPWKTAAKRTVVGGTIAALAGLHLALI